MSAIANIVVGLVALVHVYILVLEMFLWDKPAGLRAFGQTKEAAAASKVLALSRRVERSCSSRRFRQRSGWCSCCCHSWNKVLLVGTLNCSRRGA